MLSHKVRCSTPNASHIQSQLFNVPQNGGKPPTIRAQPKVVPTTPTHARTGDSARTSIGRDAHEGRRKTRPKSPSGVTCTSISDGGKDKAEAGPERRQPGHTFLT